MEQTRQQERVDRMEAQMKLNREAAEETARTIRLKMQAIDESMDSLIEQKEALTKLLWKIESQIEKLK